MHSYMGLVFQQADYGSPLYEQSKHLRNDVLCIPLGLTLGEDDVADDLNRMHFVALDGDKVVGTVSMRPLSADTVKLRQMAVVDGLQGQGVGQQLVAYAEEMMRELDFTTIVMDARCVAVPFYEKLGYAAHGDVFIDVLVEHIAMKKAL